MSVLTIRWIFHGDSALKPRVAGCLLYALACLAFCAGGSERNEELTNALARIALVSDTHTTRGTNEDQPLYRRRLDMVIEAVNEAKVDVVLIAGDLTQDGKPEEIADFRSQIESFKALVWYVPGNHDIGNKLVPGKEKESALTPFRLTRFEMRCGASFFSRELAGMRVIGLNSPIFGSGFAREKEMWRFLERELATPASRPTVVFMHYPPFTKSPDEASEYWNIEPKPRQRLLKILHDRSVQLVLTGHLHRPLVIRNDGILFVTTGPVSFGLPRGKQPQGWTLVTVPAEGEAKSEFRPISD